MFGWKGADRLAKLCEALTQFTDEEFRLLERGEVSALGGLIPVDQLGLGPLAPDPWRYKSLAWEHADGDGQVELLPREVCCEALEIEPSR
jgi:hypothetical protein